MKKWLGVLVALLVLTATFVWVKFIAAPLSQSPVEIVSFQNDTPKILVASRLRERGYVRSETAAEIILKGDLPAGGYYLSKSMTVFEVAETLGGGPQLLWVTITPGMRKEQIAEKLKPRFAWTDHDVGEFLAGEEGTYFPDTYLIPKGNGSSVRQYIFNRFNEAFAPLAPKFLEQNIKNDTALKIASLVQREASGSADMPLIAGIIWNRLLDNMILQIDAANQYALGHSGDWWPRLDGADLKIDSAYNLYLHRGLPPTPIANPGLPAIEAVLNPADTKCLFYLHDHNKQIHCSETYEEHLENIQKYLQ
jgi:UPF0755 protein